MGTRPLHARIVAAAANRTCAAADFQRARADFRDPRTDEIKGAKPAFDPTGTWLRLRERMTSWSV
jgi:hypothetical protein